MNKCLEATNSSLGLLVPKFTIESGDLQEENILFIIDSLTLNKKLGQITALTSTK